MRVGVPKEIKVLEQRVGLTPAAVGELVHHGHTVLVERGASIGESRIAPIEVGVQPDTAGTSA